MVVLELEWYGAWGLDGIYHVCDSILALYHEGAERVGQELEKYREHGCEVFALIFMGAGLWK